MPLWYHGTNKEASDKIILHGFLPHTHFAQHMEDAFAFGGDIIFAVWFDEDPSDNWQWVSKDYVSVNDILWVKQLEVTTLYESPSVTYKMTKACLISMHGETAEICEACSGTGEESRNLPGRLNTPGMAVKVCQSCQGHGISNFEEIEVVEHRTWKGRRVLTAEDMANMDCPYPPEPDYPDRASASEAGNAGSNPAGDTKQSG